MNKNWIKQKKLFNEVIKIYDKLELYADTVL